MLHIALDASGARDSGTGVGAYTRGLALALAALPGDHRVHLYGTPPDTALAALPTLRSLPVPSRGRALVWHFPDPVSPYLRTHLLAPGGGCRRPAGCLVVTVHDLLFADPAAPYPVATRRRFTEHVAAALSSGATVVAPSRWTAARLAERYGVSTGRFAVTPLAPDPRFHPLPPEEARRAVAATFGLRAPYVLYVGSSLPRKNLVGALAAISLLRRRGADGYRLAVVGATARDAAACCRLQGLEPREDVLRHTNCLGKVPGPLMPLLYNGAEALLYPSLAEGFGLPVLEAMACGLPVVSADTSAIPEVAGDAALLVDPGDPEALAGALERVLGDGRLRRNLVEKGLRRARAFTWERTARETLAAYRRAGPPGV